MAYEIGDDIVITIKWRSRADNELVEPTDFQVRLQPPNDQAEQVLVGGIASQLTKIADGHWELLISTDRADDDDAGYWVGWVTSTGTGKASQSFRVTVEPATLTV